MTQQEKYDQFKSLHERDGAFMIPNPWDAGTARILTSLEFEALATTSAGLAFSLGRNDGIAGTLSRDLILSNAKQIVEATHLPVNADLERGFGDAPEICAETIRMASDIGLVGGSIEDATGRPEDPIYEFEHAVERVAAAAEASSSRPILLTARAENFLHRKPDLDDTIKRLQAFEAAGADVLYAPGLPGIDAIRTVCSSVSKPVNVVMGLVGDIYSLEQLAEAGVKRVSVGGSFAVFALSAFLRAAKEVKEEGTFTYTRDSLPREDLSRIFFSK